MYKWDLTKYITLSLIKWSRTINKQTARQTDRQTDRQTVRVAEPQHCTNKHTHRQKDSQTYNVLTDRLLLAYSEGIQAVNAKMPKIFFFTKCTFLTRY